MTMHEAAQRCACRYPNPVKRGLAAGALYLLGLGLACGGKDGPADSDPLSRACTGLGSRLRECGLLSAGPIDCSSGFVTQQLSIGAEDSDEVGCDFDCYAKADCTVLESLECEDAASVSTGASLVYECFLGCAKQFGFQCANPGTGLEAVPVFAVCNGESDCDDGSDELGCALFACGGGLSVGTRAVCDGFMDCSNGQDEAQNCQTFDCGDGSTVPTTWRCDGDPDCADASDEAGCPERAIVTCGG
jgi:hypothetical protein